VATVHVEAEWDRDDEVDRLCASFDTIYEGFPGFVADLADADRAALFHDNAVRVYRIDRTVGSS
jgi:hypothetical protein